MNRHKNDRNAFGNKENDERAWSMECDSSSLLHDDVLCTTNAQTDEIVDSTAINDNELADANRTNTTITPCEPVEKADENTCLESAKGVLAWKLWIMSKNAEIESGFVQRQQYKMELLRLTTAELNYSLGQFVKEVRKLDGSKYAPDEIYCFVLDIQMYLRKQGRMENIFTDFSFESFIDCFDEVAKEFSVVYNDSRKCCKKIAVGCA